MSSIITANDLYRINNLYKILIELEGGNQPFDPGRYILSLNDFGTMVKLLYAIYLNKDKENLSLIKSFFTHIMFQKEIEKIKTSTLLEEYSQILFSKNSHLNIFDKEKELPDEEDLIKICKAKKLIK